MNKAIQLISDYFLLKGGKGHDPEELLTLRIFQVVIGSMVVLFTTMAVHFALNGLYDGVIIQLTVVTISCFSWVVFRKTGSTVIAVSLILAAGIPLVVYRGYTLGGINSSTFVMIQIIPISAMALMPFSAAAMWTFAYSLIPIAFYNSKALGFEMPQTPLAMAAPSTRVILLTGVQIVSFLVVYYVKKLSASYAGIAQRKTEEKTNLVRIITHDIATPLAVLHYGLELIKDRHGESPEMQRLEKAMKAIQGITTKVRELEAIQSGKKEFHMVKVCMVRAFDDLIAIYATALKKKNIQFNLHYEGSGEQYCIDSDEKGLTFLVLSNLLSNAIKFTASGGKIDVYIENHQNKVICRFVDTGIGMPEKILQHLFDPTKHTNRKGTAGEVGTGFGMPIVKSLIDKFGGTIKVESRSQDVSPQNHGTVFTLTFPQSQNDTVLPQSA